MPAIVARPLAKAIYFQLLRKVFDSQSYGITTRLAELLIVWQKSRALTGAFKAW
jgi:hypothetical protein